MADQNPKSKMRLDWEFLAKEYGIKDYDKLTNNNLQRALRDKVPEGKSIGEAIAEARAKKSGNASSSSSSSSTHATVSAEVKTGEVIPPGASQNFRTDVQAPVINMNVPAPIVNIGSREAPRWHEMVNNLWTIGLHMVLGAAVYAVFTHTSFQSVAMLTGH